MSTGRRVISSPFFFLSEVAFFAGEMPLRRYRKNRLSLNVQSTSKDGTGNATCDEEEIEIISLKSKRLELFERLERLQQNAQTGQLSSR